MYLALLRVKADAETEVRKSGSEAEAIGNKKV